MSPEHSMAVRFICAFALLLLFTVPRRIQRFRRRLDRDEQKRLDFACNLSPKKKSPFTK